MTKRKVKSQVERQEVEVVNDELEYGLEFLESVLDDNFRETCSPRNERESWEFSGLTIDPAKWQAYCLNY